MFIPPSSNASPGLKLFEVVLGLVLIVTPYTYALVKGCYNSFMISEERTIVGLSESYLNSSWKIDLTDGQYRKIHENLFLLISVCFCFIIFRKILTLFRPEVKFRIIYYALFGACGLFYLHGLGMLVLLAIIIGNFLLCKAWADKPHFPIIAWGVNFTLLMWSKTEYSKYNLYEFIFNWNTCFGMAMLKMMSFMLDFHYFKLERPFESQQEHMAKCSECEKYHPCTKFYMQYHADDFSLLTFISYVFYLPLYVAGPTTTYNTWVAQVSLPQSLVSFKYILQYFVRLVIVFILLETLLHFSFYHAITDGEANEDIWKNFGIYEMIFASYCILNFIWLKFTFIWRYFRLVALIDGVEPPENMGRCMSNSYCFIEFWKNWHKSFNLWLVRYLYIPLGGGRYKVFNIWVVFGFVALWHDLSINLLVWGWGMCLIIMPEVILQTYFSREKFANFRGTLGFTWLCAFAGGIDCFFMAAANLVGFAFGVYGMKIIVQEVTIGLLLKMYAFFILHTNVLRLLLRYRTTKKEVKKEKE